MLETSSVNRESILRGREYRVRALRLKAACLLPPLLASFLSFSFSFFLHYSFHLASLNDLPDACVLRVLRHFWQLSRMKCARRRSFYFIGCWPGKGGRGQGTLSVILLSSIVTYWWLLSRLLDKSSGRGPWEVPVLGLRL